MIKPKAAFHLLLLWHGLLAGGYTIAYLTSEGSFALHQFAGWLVVGLLALRLVAASLVSEQSSWALPWASLALWSGFWRRLRQGDFEVFRQRTPLVPLTGLVVLTTMVLASVTGLAADGWKWEEVHEGLAEGSLAVVFTHVGLVSLPPLLKKLGKEPQRVGSVAGGVKGAPPTAA